MGKIKQVGRTILSFLPRVGLKSRPETYKPAGLSVMMTIKNEEDWIEKSISSISGIADEIVAVDNGSDDETPVILDRLERRMNGTLRVFRYEREDYCAAVNFTLAQTRFRWIFRWPGDFVARTTGLVVRAPEGGRAPRTVSRNQRSAISDQNAAI